MLQICLFSKTLNYFFFKTLKYFFSKTLKYLRKRCSRVILVLTIHCFFLPPRAGCCTMVLEIGQILLPASTSLPQNHKMGGVHFLYIICDIQNQPFVVCTVPSFLGKLTMISSLWEQIVNRIQILSENYLKIFVSLQIFRF